MMVCQRVHTSPSRRGTEIIYTNTNTLQASKLYISTLAFMKAIDWQADIDDVVSTRERGSSEHTDWLVIIHEVDDDSFSLSTGDMAVLKLVCRGMRLLRKDAGS